MLPSVPGDGRTWPGHSVEGGVLCPARSSGRRCATPEDEARALPRPRGAVREPADRAAITLSGRADVAVGGAAATLLLGRPLAPRLVRPLGRPAAAVTLTLTAAMAVALNAAVAV